MGEYIRAKTTKEAIERLCAYTSPRDREWAWWLTMRELAAVAGLALWVEGDGMPPDCVVREVHPTWLGLFCGLLGWEAPDGE